MPEQILNQLFIRAAGASPRHTVAAARNNGAEEVAQGRQRGWYRIRGLEMRRWIPLKEEEGDEEVDEE
jgi:hypothetical protein